MTRTCSTPDCERPHVAKGLCSTCHQRKRRRAISRERLGGPIPCAVCRTPFLPSRKAARYCCEGCMRFSSVLNERRERGMNEEIFCTRDAQRARRYALLLKERGFPKVHPRAAAASVSADGYYSPWRRPCGLYVIRVKWPTERREEAAA